MKKRRPKFEDLIKQNKLELMENKKELDRIDLKIENKHAKELELVAK
ncbi:FbpB family small basic protein [Bacillus sp. Marseille-P3661]|nr:FbpB family small basic protein [Bacillus sp. Marseille-P3661]